MSSDEEKYSFPVMQNDCNQNSSSSSDLQEEYEELLRYTIVTPNVEPGTSQPSHSKGEVAPDVRFHTIIDDTLHNQVRRERETRTEVRKGCDLNISGHSKTEGLSPVSSPRKPFHPVMDFFSSNILGDSSTPGSNSSHAGIHEIIVGNSVVSEENLQKVESVLDLWSSGLKTNVISELTKWRLNFIDWHRMEMKKEKEKHAAHLKQLCNQINSLKELQKAYEISIGRKDEVISSLSHAIGKQKERMELMRTFFHWRIGHVKSRQDAYEGKLADQYFQRNLLKKVWIGWHSTVQKKWKDLVERACQARAEEVCVQISNDYENKVAVLSGALENAKAELQRMQHEKEHFEDSMKKAFMRGVCALNLEAMTMFQNRNDADFTNSKKEEYGPVHLDPSAPIPTGAAPAPSSAATAMGGASTAAFPSATSITSAGTASASCVSAPLGAGSTAPTASEETYVPRVVTSAQQKAGRTITARITGRSDFASKNRISSSLAIMGVSPPMSSVVVEKHHPVTVQTIPQAAAAKYPRTIHPESTTSASRSLGTRSTHTQSLTSVHSIKVVD
ncbi:centrosomal protein POC5 isoform X1 [Myotis daubentonii]|uniref:centrosomal protein POC5 isoform X1 n=2 Tax=Myotis daubentonii TaxID=98922 RepID=UPI002873E879|nr:centrosomal protein POC5 isoform X1 [Myotis daubentonii]XP_059550276.1 centrosomal protein POC5 isoform X1 [Myotis daubentonii]XP_059550277.1 centrosomal protein POC5 isoform X1 [Myotis daubentonii]